MKCLLLAVIFYTALAQSSNFFSVDILYKKIMNVFANIQSQYEKEEVYLPYDGIHPEIRFTNIVLELAKEINPLHGAPTENLQYLNHKFMDFINVLNEHIVMKKRTRLSIEQWNNIKAMYDEDNHMHRINAIIKNSKELFRNSIDAMPTICENHTEFNLKRAIDHYKNIIASLLKVFLITKYTNLMKQRYRLGGANNVIDIAEYVEECREIFKSIYANPKPYWCRPRKQEKGKTYEELHVYQGYIVNEVNLNAENCKQDCPSYTFVSGYNKCKKLSGEYCEPKLCIGNLKHCQFLNSDMQLCQSKSPNRRYENIKLANGKILGTTQYQCSRREEVESWKRWFVNCHYCMCICENRSSKLANRYISLEPALSNIRRNKVVTGVRFVKIDNLIYFQIQEGKLLPQGEIDQISVDWVPVKTFKLTDPHKHRQLDYFEVLDNSRSVGLDQVIKSPSRINQVVTGVRFKVENINSASEAIVLEVQMTAFDFETGRLNLNHRYYLSAATSQKRREIALDNSERPDRDNSLPQMLSGNREFVKFTYTSMDKDVAQSTVPFFDINPLSPETAVPLSGLGIFLKGNKGYGGYLAPSMYIYNFTMHIP